MVKRLVVVLAVLVGVLSLMPAAGAVVITDGGHPSTWEKCSLHNRCVTIAVQVSMVGGHVSAEGSVLCKDGTRPVRRVMRCEYIFGAHLQLFIDNGSLFAEAWAPTCGVTLCPLGSYGFSTAHPVAPLWRNWFASLKVTAVGLYQNDEVEIFDATSNSGIWP